MASSSRKYKPRSDDDDSSGPHVPPPPNRGRRSDEEHTSGRKQRRRSRYAAGHDMPREKSPKVDLLLCRFTSPSSHSWGTAPLSFDRRRIDDRDLWEDIRQSYRMELQMPWRRVLSLKKVKHIVPVTVYHLHRILLCESPVLFGHKRSNVCGLKRDLRTSTRHGKSEPRHEWDD